MNQHAREPITSGMKGSYYFCSLIISVENCVPLYVDVPCTSGRVSDLPFEAVLQEYFQFPYEYFLLVLTFRGYCCKFVLQRSSEEKITRIEIR
jgi:hypothetical protein